MRAWHKALLTTACAVPLVAAAALGIATWLALEDQPTVALAAPPGVADIARAYAVVQQHDPRRALPGIVRSLNLQPRDLELVLAEGSRRLGSPPRTQVRLADGAADIQASLALRQRGTPMAEARHWLNLQLQLRQGSGLPEVQSLRLGGLRLPGWLVQAAVPPALQLLGLQAQAQLGWQMVHQVRLTPQRLELDFAWPDNLQQRLAATLLDTDDQARMKVYADHLATLTRQFRRGPGPQQSVPLQQLMQPMFELAQQRSEHNGQPAAENRAALITLAMLVTGQGRQGWQGAQVPGQPASANAAWAPIRVTLGGRTDTPQHYLVSAALALQAGGPLSNAIGLYKEVSDSMGGSGFSFNDLAADRAGTRLGELAAQSPEALQARLASLSHESELLPRVADLPEDLQLLAFNQRFGGLDSATYRRLLTDIENRLNQLPLLAPPRRAGS